jgi:hypothetical protein
MRAELEGLLESMVTRAPSVELLVAPFRATVIRQLP